VKKFKEMCDVYYMHENTCLIIAISIICCLTIGCIAVGRYETYADVKENGSSVVTKNRYTLVRYEEDANSKPRHYSDEEWKNALADMARRYEKSLKKFQPGVFSDNGIPIVIRGVSERFYLGENGGGLGFYNFFAVCSFCILPYFNSNRSTEAIEIMIEDNPAVGFDVEFVRKDRQMDVMLCSPFSIFAFGFPYDAPDWKGVESNYKQSANYCNLLPFDGSSFSAAYGKSYERVQAYAIASKLKEMEDSGKITEAIVARARSRYSRPNRQSLAPRGESYGGPRGGGYNVPPPPSLGEERPNPPRRPTYGNINCERVPGCDFAFTYSVEILDKSQNQIDVWGEVQGKIGETVRKMYAISFPSSSRERIVVDFPEHDLVNGRISGRAVVLAITPVSLNYDADTMCGKLVVRLNAAQFAEARDWIRKNIGTLARDKNIALLTSGQPPPVARYYSLSEKFEDNIMEIEFRTE